MFQSSSRTHPFLHLARILWHAWGLALLLALSGLGSAWAQALLPVPALTAHVIDQTGALSPADKAAIEAKLTAYEQKKGTQIAVLMVPTTQPEDIASYANRVASTWKIGRRQVGDGLLIIVAKDDRRMRIEVAKALEGAVPDLAAGHIIDEVMKPAFRSGNFAAGISGAIDQVTARIDGEALPAPGQRPQGGAGAASADGVDWLNAVVIVGMIALVGGAIFKSILGRFFGSAATGAAAGGVMFMLSGALVAAGVAGFVAMLIALLTGLGNAMSSGMRRGGGPIILPGPPGGGWGGGFGGGGGGFGGGGGGFDPGGGGDFGGGGASGDW